MADYGGVLSDILEGVEPPERANQTSQYCEYCDRALVKDYSGREVVMRCNSCKTEVPGNAEVAPLGSDWTGSTSELKRFATLIANAPFDPVSIHIYRTCSRCKKSTMALSRVGETLATVYSCTCGNVEVVN